MKRRGYINVTSGEIDLPPIKFLPFGKLEKYEQQTQLSVNFFKAHYSVIYTMDYETLNEMFQHQNIPTMYNRIVKHVTLS